MINMRKKNFMNYCGLLGIVALLSYTVAVVFSPLDYLGYNWMAQAVSDLSASNAPSLGLWNQLSSLYNICTLICAMMVCAGIQGKGSRLLRTGIYLFTAMEWISAVGFSMFPLSDSGYAGTFQDKMHILSTILVVLLACDAYHSRNEEERISQLRCVCRNCAGNDVSWCTWNEYRTERIFWCC